MSRDRDIHSVDEWINYAVAEQRAEQRSRDLRRRYRRLQRRTILYGLLSMSIAMYITLWIIFHLNPSLLQSSLLGAGIAFIMSMSTAYIVRKCNPLS